MDTINILFCGLGGQGILTASEILAIAAMNDNYIVKKSEIHGMAQRGGSVETHVRIGKKIFSPVIEQGKVDFLISFDIDEYNKNKYTLKENGKDLFSEYLNIKENIKEVRFINICMLGILSKYLNISTNSWYKAINEVIKLQFINDNISFFNLARKNSSEI